MAPVVLRHHGFRVSVLLPPREHGPPHVHVSKAGTVAVIELPTGDQPIRIRSVDRMTQADVVSAYRLVQASAELLLASWRRYHDPADNH